MQDLNENSTADQDDYLLLWDVSNGSIRKIKVANIITGSSGGVTGAVDSVNGRDGVVTLSASDVDLENVDNTADLNKPVSTAQQSALDSKADLDHDHTSSEIIDFNAAVDAILTTKGIEDGATADLTGTEIVSEIDTELGGPDQWRINTSTYTIVTVLPTASAANYLYKYTVNNPNDPALHEKNFQCIELNGSYGYIEIAQKGDTGDNGTDITDAEVKVKYEANQDTNAYTDAEKAKVANVPADTASTLSGKSDTGHTHTKYDVGLSNVDNTSDADKPVSTAQAAANVADRYRANHIGTQAAATISDFAAAVGLLITGKADVTVTDSLASDIDAKQASLVMATQLEMETGTEPALKGMSPLLVRQAIEAVTGDIEAALVAINGV